MLLLISFLFKIPASCRRHSLGSGPYIGVLYIGIFRFLLLMSGILLTFCRLSLQIHPLLIAP